MKRDPSTDDGTPGLGDQYKDERTEKKIQEHLNNENDIITEQDIANAPVGVVNNEQNDEMSESEKEAMLQLQRKQEEEKIKDNEDPEIGSAWNVLES